MLFCCASTRAIFANAFGEEALQLFRDRSRDETGLSLQIRLWVDLLRDLFAFVWQIRRHDPAALAGATSQPGSIAAPKFLVLDYEAPRIPWMLLAGVISGVMFGLIVFSLGQHRSSRRLPFLPLFREAAGSRAFRPE